jgi:hypothetical protein
MRVPFFCTLIPVLCALILLTTFVFAQDTNFATGPQYLMNYGSPLFAQSIATPSMSLSAPPLQVGADLATFGLTAGAENQTLPASSISAQPIVDFFPIYYGVVAEQAIDISFRETSLSPDQLPASIQDSGVWELTTPKALLDRGYGLTLGDAAAQSKSRLRHAPRTYTNADIDRLHSGS